MAKTRGAKRLGRGRGRGLPREQDEEIEQNEEVDACDGNDDELEEEFGDVNADNDFDHDLTDHLPVAEIAAEAAEVLAAHFGNIAHNSESDDSADEIWRDDVTRDPPSEDEEEVENSGNVHSENKDEEEAEILKLGKYFGSASDFKQALLRYSLASRYDIKLYISTEKRLCAICSDKTKTCRWRVYCSYEREKNKLQIKVFESKHTCIRSGYSKMLKISTIAQLYEEKLRVHPKFRAVEMSDEIKRRYNLIVTDEQCRKAKEKLSKARRKALEAQFARIWDYAAEIHRTNVGTTIDIETILGQTPGSFQRFYRIYICFHTQKEAWTRYCRPIIGLDGALLKWDVKGQLIAAVGRDGDNRIIPIAWAVVDVQNEVNWEWFLQHLKQDLRFGNGHSFTIISDKQKGLVNAIKSQLPEGEHRLCARHVLNSWKRDGDMQFERLFWRVGRSYTEGEFIASMAALKELNPTAHDTLVDTKPETWSRVFFKVGSCCNDILNNLSESFNKTLREVRKKPLLDLLVDIRRQCMVRIAKRSVLANWLKTAFTRSVHRQIDESIKKTRECVLYSGTNGLHEVTVHGGCSYRVEMLFSKCGCGKWQLIGIPCEHAATVIIANKLQPEAFVSQYFTTNTWQNTYRHSIQPVQGMMLWPRVDRLPVLPPPDRSGKAGRPSNYARHKSAGESSKTKLSRAKRIMTCCKCKGEGHNKSSCKANPVEPHPKRPRGRPRKTLVASSQ